MIMPGRSEATWRLRERIARLNQEERLNKRPFGRAILLEGPTGAGKEFFGKALCAHWLWSGWDDASQQAYMEGKPEAFQWLKVQLNEEFYAVSVTDLMGDVGFAELVGCTKGAFTGAASERVGILGSKCTHIMIDEISDASPQLQGQLLRIVQHRKRRPVGGEVDDEVEISARLLFAGNRPLSEEVRRGKFREDLYHRLQGSRIELPALTKTPDRIAELTESLANEVYDEKAFSGRTRCELSQTDLDWACGQQWPGNVRQLRRTVETWVNSAILDEKPPALKDCFAGDEHCAPSAAARSVETSVLEMVIDDLASEQIKHNGFAEFVGRFRTLFASALFYAYDKKLVNRQMFEMRFRNVRSVIDQARKYYDDNFPNRL
jgi:transcriptional regulator with AAA-type ATPase domain